MKENISLELLLCLSPLAVIFIVMKLALWLNETASFNSETEKLKRMQRGPYGPYGELGHPNGHTINLDKVWDDFEIEDVTDSVSDWEDFWRNEDTR